MRLGAIAAAAALLGAGAAEAQQRSRPTDLEIFCHDLRRLANESPDFEDMYRAHPAPPWLGFRPGVCRASSAEGPEPAAYWCHQNLAPAHLTEARLSEMTAACLPEAKRVPQRGWRQALFETERLRISISEHGFDRGKVGRTVRYRVEAITPTR